MSGPLDLDGGEDCRVGGESRGKVVDLDTMGWGGLRFKLGARS